MFIDLDEKTKKKLLILSCVAGLVILYELYAISPDSTNDEPSQKEDEKIVPYTAGYRAKKKEAEPEKAQSEDPTPDETA
jgi:hypothetical protein